MRRGEGGWQTTARALQSTCEWNCFAGWGGSRVQRCVLFPWPKFFTFKSSESIRSMGESSGLQEKEGKHLTCITISHRRLVRREHFFYNNYQTLSSSSADSSRSWLHVENCTRVNTTIQVVSDFQRSCFFPSVMQRVERKKLTARNSLFSPNQFWFLLFKAPVWKKPDMKS